MKSAPNLGSKTYGQIMRLRSILQFSLRPFQIKNSRLKAESESFFQKTKPKIFCTEPERGDKTCNTYESRP